MTTHAQGTRAEVTTNLNITGKPAQFGRGVMQDVSDKLLSRFVDCLQQRLSSASTNPDQATPQPSTETSTARPAGSGTAAPPATSSTNTTNDALDLGSSILPTLAHHYAPHLATGLLSLLIGWLLGRRSR